MVEQFLQFLFNALDLAITFLQLFLGFLSLNFGIIFLCSGPPVAILVKLACFIVVKLDSRKHDFVYASVINCNKRNSRYDFSHEEINFFAWGELRPFLRWAAARSGKARPLRAPSELRLAPYKSIAFTANTR